MERREIRIEYIKGLPEEEFECYGQIFGVERGAPSEDIGFVQCWSDNIRAWSEGEGVDFCYCRLRNIDEGRVIEMESSGVLPGWLKGFKGGRSVSKLERHPLTAETFFFLEGDVVFVVAPPDNDSHVPDTARMRAFPLTRVRGTGPRSRYTMRPVSE